VTLDEIKQDAALEGMVLRTRQRLSVQPVSEKHFRYIREKLA
jgi:predicted RNA-binding protein with PUA-like domain